MPKPRPDYARFNLDVPKSMLDDIDTLVAQSHYRTRTAYITALLFEHIETEKTRTEYVEPSAESFVGVIDDLTK